MGQELSTDINEDYVIIFNDDTTKRISKSAADNIMRMSASSAKFFLLDGQMFAFSNMARLITIKEYWEQYPDERPVSYKTFPKIEPPDEPYVGISRRIYNSEKNLKSALKIWQKQMDDPGFVKTTGGLAGLIAWAEKKLAVMAEDHKKKLEIKVSLNVGGGEKKTPIAPVRTRSEILREIRERRGNSVGELLIKTLDGV